MWLDGIYHDLDQFNSHQSIFSSGLPCVHHVFRSPEKSAQPDGSFTPTVTEDETFLHTYNCNWEPFPRKNDLSHRRKQVCYFAAIIAS